MTKYFPVGVCLGGLVVAAFWLGGSVPGLRAGGPQPSAPGQPAVAGVRSPDGGLTVYYRLKGAVNVAQLEGVTAIEFYPGCIVIQYRQGTVHRGQVLFTDRTEDLSWLPAQVKK